MKLLFYNTMFGEQYQESIWVRRHGSYVGIHEKQGVVKVVLVAVYLAEAYDASHHVVNWALLQIHNLNEAASSISTRVSYNGIAVPASSPA